MRFCIAMLAVAWFSMAQDARMLFEQRCAPCHGNDAAGSDRGPALARSRRLRNRSSADIRDTIRNGTAAGMPAFPMPVPELDALANWIHSLNANASEGLKTAGNPASGEQSFFGAGQCANCHTARGRGKSIGPDLTEAGQQFTAAQLTAKLEDPKAPLATGYTAVTIRLRGGVTVRGYVRRQTIHSLQFESLDGKLLLLGEGEFEIISRDRPANPHFLKSSSRDVLAYLATLDSVPSGPITASVPPVAAADIDRILHPQTGEWLTYNGAVSGNRHSPLTQIHRGNVQKLAMQFAYTLPYFGLEATPLVMDGVMYISGPNQVHALDARSGDNIWTWSRARTTRRDVPGDAAKGANRGVALLGSRVFFATDDAHMVCLDRLTGALLWDVTMPETLPHYGATLAPLVAGDLVVGGVTGADEGMRGFVAAYHANTGKLAWRFYTVPAHGEPASETWKGNALDTGGGSTWLTGSYDPETHLLYWPTGNPYPDTDGTERQGDNLFTDCILALDAPTGRLRWHYQFTPHDLHDWDSQEPPVLVDAEFNGRPRKLLLHADRNGFYYVLDRTNGELLLAKPFAKKLTWATGIDAKGRPILLPGNQPSPEGTPTCPDIRGATNWMSTAYTPATGLYYFIAIENCGTYRSTQFGGGGGRAPGKEPGFDRGGDIFTVTGADPPRRYLRAIEMRTGKLAWEVDQMIPDPNYGGVLSTAGGLVFYSESTGAFAAVDDRTGRTLWHFETGQPPKASPMTYSINGRQYVAIAAGASVYAFALPQ